VAWWWSRTRRAAEKQVTFVGDFENRDGEFWIFTGGAWYPDRPQ
jgi:hypothetical protein